MEKEIARCTRRSTTVILLLLLIFQMSCLQAKATTLSSDKPEKAVNRRVDELQAPGSPRAPSTNAQTLKRHESSLNGLSHQERNASPMIGRKLPTWFNFGLFKQLHGKRYKSPKENELHKRIYLQTALKVLEQRALFRLGQVQSLATLNELSDLTSEQLEQLKELNRASSRQQSVASNRSTTVRPAESVPGVRLPDCCSYDQVYERIIELLNSTMSANQSNQQQHKDGKRTKSFARALMEELEQKSLIPGADEPEVGAENQDKENYQNRSLSELLSSYILSRKNNESTERDQTQVEMGRPDGARPSDGAARVEVQSMLEAMRARKRGRSNSGQAKDEDNESGDQVTKSAPWQSGAKRVSDTVKSTETKATHRLRPNNSTDLVKQREPERPGPKSLLVPVGEDKSSTRSPANTSTRQPWHRNKTGPSQATSHSSSTSTTVPESKPERDGQLNIEEAIKQQIAQQLSPDSPVGKHLSKQLSELYGEPITIRVRNTTIAGPGLSGGAMGEPATKSVPTTVAPKKS